MNLIDFHTHYYTGGRPDSAVKYLKDNGYILPGKDGELKGLLKFMKEDGVDLSVNAPVAVSAEECVDMNVMLVENNKKEKKVISLGSIHPSMAADGSAVEELAFLSKNGIKGIKLHPQEQKFLPDEEYLKPLYEACIKLDLFVLMHAGADAEPEVDAENVMARPFNIMNVVQTYPELKLIAAHMGGLQMWDEVIKYLLGRKVYFDTAYISLMPDKQFQEFVKEHGSEYVLFGSDFPWVRAGMIKKKIEKTVKNSQAKENIFNKNAEKLLGL